MKAPTILGTGMIATIVGLTGCNTVPINPNDATPPAVVIKVKGSNGQYAAASTANMSASQAGTLDVMCVVTDPEGVKAAALSFSSGVDSCTTNEGGIFSGKFYISPAPDNASQTLTGDSSGKVPDTAFLMRTVKGPFTCDVPPKGIPYGTAIVATCHGENWSSNAANKGANTTLTIHLN